MLKLAHSNLNLKVFGYLNNTFIGITENIHEIEALPKKGNYLITAIDNLGNEINKEIQIKD